VDKKAIFISISSWYCTDPAHFHYITDITEVFMGVVMGQAKTLFNHRILQTIPIHLR